MPSEQLKLPTLLLIADNPSIVHWIKQNLEQKFYIVEAVSLSEALELARFAQLDFIIVDSHFEECDALKLTNQLRQINTTTPIFLITGRLKKSYRADAIASGVTDFLNDQLAIEELEMRFASGRKEAKARKKTSSLSTQIAPQKSSSQDDSLKTKIFLEKKTGLLLASARQSKEPLSFLLLRPDQFGKLQKEEGALETELLLSLLEKRLSQHLEKNDLLIASSNGFFIVLLPATSLSQAQQTAEKLRRFVQRPPFEFHQKTISLTISIMIGELNGSEKQYQQAIHQGMQSLNSAQNISNVIITLNEKTVLD